MKKEVLPILVSLFLVIVMITSLASCKNTGNKIDKTTDNEQITEEPSTEEPSKEEHSEDEQPSKDNPSKDEPSGEDENDEFVPILRFAIISDIHTRAKGDKNTTDDEVEWSASRTEQFLKATYSYAEGEDYKNVDAFIFAGDYTDNGGIYEYSSFTGVVNDNIQTGTQFLACLGNHEFFYTGEDAYTNNVDFDDTYARFETNFGYDADSVNIINGYYFIGVSPDANGGRGISESKADWLDAQIQTAVAADSTGKKPIFVFCHLPCSQTTLGSFETKGGNYPYSVAPLDDVLKDYPQVVFMAGHTHSPNTDPESIYQKDFTSINTGTFAYGNYPIYTDDGSTYTFGFQLTTTGSFQNGMKDEYNEHGDKESGIFTIIETDAQNRIRIRYYSADDDTFVLEPVIIDSIGDKESFTFTSERKTSSEVPYFSEDLTINSLSSTFAIVNIPNARSKDYVRNYRVDLCLGSNIIKTIYRLACQNQLTGDVAITASFSNLLPDTDYTIEVFAYNAYGKMSEPISISIKTAKESIYPDVFSFEAKDNNTAIDRISGDAAKITGTPETEYDSELEMNVASFDGSSSFDFSVIKNYYDVLSEGFSFEILGKVESLPKTKYLNMVSNQEKGGFGYEYYPDGNVYIYVYVLNTNKSGSYKRTGVALPVGEYFHLFATYDGEYIKIYLNGNLGSEEKAVGTVWFPIKDSARYICVGGDSSLYGKSENLMSGKIALANVYGKALSDTEIAQTYDDLGLDEE